MDVPISDRKKCQTLLNLAANAVDGDCPGDWTTPHGLKGIASRLEACRQAFLDQNVDPTGTPLEGNVQQISAWIDAVRAVADDPVANGLLAHRVCTHRAKALGDF
jgi:hypothetical protein